MADLQGDPRLPYATLGGRLGVTGMTAANRIQRLRQADLLRIRIRPNFDACGLNTEILGLIQADTNVLATCIAALEASQFVIRIDRVTGEYDLSFVAVFPAEMGMGPLVREIQALPGVRRLVVHHRLETVKDDDGWSAVWSEPEVTVEEAFEIAPNVQIADALRARVIIGAQWLVAFVRGDIERVRELSEPDIVFTIMPPYAGAGTYDGFQAIEEEARVAAHIYRHLWHRIIGASETNAPYDVLIDAFNTAEHTRGDVTNRFVRMAFGFENERVRRVLTLGQFELPDIPGAPKI